MWIQHLLIHVYCRTQVRIFVEDRDEDASVASLLDLQLRDMLATASAGTAEVTYNLDFFNSSSMTFPPHCAGSSAPTTFEGFGARRVGASSAHASILPLSTATPKSVMSGYDPAIEYRSRAELSIQYTLNISLRNGIVPRLAMAGVNDTQNCVDESDAPEDSRCREKVLNMDQTICAVAYDNSRSRHRRWVGKTDPNGPQVGWALRDHSNGDVASALHCWRLRLQSPPTFVTNWAKTMTPLHDSYLLEGWAGDPLPGDVYDSSTDRVMQVGVNELSTLVFVAQDPNPGDTVEILILDDPGMPVGMATSGTKCVPRGSVLSTGANIRGMCRADDVGGIEEGAQTALKEAPSDCSKAMLTLEWSPSADQVDKDFRVCVIAKDSSTACSGKGPPAEEATSRGWFGEQQCVTIHVMRPALSWVLDGSPNEFVSYVGCTSRVAIRVQDCSLASAPACRGRYLLYIEASTSLPAGSRLHDGTSSVGFRERVLEWVPTRGTEGSVVTMCFTAGDVLHTQAPLEEQCWNVTVQKCQYCVKSSDTLAVIMKEYGLDTNWLRLWLHNGNNAPSEPVPRITNPDLIIKPHNVSSLQEYMGNALGQPVVWAGVMYEARSQESLSAVAVRFRTTVGALLRSNPDIASSDLALTGTRVEDQICVIPCSTPVSAVEGAV